MDKYTPRYPREDSLKLTYVEMAGHEGYCFTVGDRIFGPFEDRIVAIIEMRRQSALKEQV